MHFISSVLMLYKFYISLFVFLSIECSHPLPLGAEDGNISDSQFSSSSQYDYLNGPHNARLQLTAVTGIRAGG